MLINAGRYPAAVESARRLVGMFHDGMTANDRYAAYVTLATACSPAGDVEGALAAAKEAIALRPDAFEGHMQAAVALSLSLESEAAAKAYERALERCPKNTPIEQHLRSQLAVVRGLQSS